jgi:signal transduction histidine kinase
MIIKQPGRTPVHVSSSGRALTAPDGTPLGAVVAMNDVTRDRAQRSELAAKNAELQRSNTELEQFAGVVSHDLAAPLGVVGGYLELLFDLYEHELDPQATKWVQSATRAVGRMQHLIEALLTYARAGNGPCRLRRADLSEAADQAVMDLRGAIRDSGATVLVGTLPAASCDPTLIRQLLQNLIGNGIKYRHPDRACRVRVDARRDSGGCVVTVTDNGLGIPAGDRARVFEMFTRIDRSGPGGHGVGLSTCQRIVERHGGRIWAEAAEGGGTVVAFTLPGA